MRSWMVFLHGVAVIRDDILVMGLEKMKMKPRGIMTKT